MALRLFELGYEFPGIKQRDKITAVRALNMFVNKLYTTDMRTGHRFDFLKRQCNVEAGLNQYWTHRRKTINGYISSS